KSAALKSAIDGGIKGVEHVGRVPVFHLAHGAAQEFFARSEILNQVGGGMKSDDRHLLFWLKLRDEVLGHGLNHGSYEAGIEQQDGVEHGARILGGLHLSRCLFVEDGEVFGFETG